MFNLLSKKESIPDILYLENLLPKRMENDLERIFLSEKIPWYTDGAVWGKEFLDLDESVLKNRNLIDDVGFHHMLFYNSCQLSEFFPITNSVLYFLEKKLNFTISEILRIRARMTTRVDGHNENKYCGPHVDFLGEKDYYSFVYYIHDTDGDTFIFDETVDTVKNKSNVLIDPKILQRFKPKKGTGVFFRGDIYHAGNHPIKENMRVIINYDFRIEK